VLKNCYLKGSLHSTVPELIGLETPPLVYGGRDPHIPSQRIPAGEVDVAAIARSTTQTGKQRLLTMEYDSIHAMQNLRLPRTTHSRHLSPAIVPGEGWGGKAWDTLFFLQPTHMLTSFL
jgi:hypothetical protein